MSIIILLIAIFSVSYFVNRRRGVPDAAKDSLKLTSIVAGAFVVLGTIVYILT